MEYLTSDTKPIDHHVNIDDDERSAGFLSSQWYWIVLLILIIMGGALRIHNIDSKYLWYDEALSLFYISGCDRAETISYLENKGAFSIKDLQECQAPKPNTSINDVIMTLVKYDTPTNPLYYLLLRLWMIIFGSTITAARSLSAVLGVLSIFALYWLSFELFHSKLASIISITIFGVSPIFIIFAQEARNYSLWCLAIILSAAALLRVLRRNTNFDWFVLFVSCVIGIYTTPLFIFSIVIMILYVFVLEKFRWNKITRNIILTQVGVIVTFSPWIWAYINSIDVFRTNLGWTANEMSILELARGWIHNYSTIFWDIGYNQNKLLNYPIRMIVLLFEIYAVIYLLKNSTKKIWILILPIIILPWLTLAIPDILLGGSRSSNARYLFLSYNGILLAVSYLIYQLLLSKRYLLRRLGSFFLITILIFGFVFIGRYDQADTWWNKDGNNQWITVSRIINKSDNPVVFISKTTGLGWGNLYALSHVLYPKVSFSIKPDPVLLIYEKNYSNVYWLLPSSEEISTLERETPIEVKIVTPNLLWQLLLQ